MAKKEDKNKTTFKKGLVAGVLGFTMMASSAGMLTACGPQRGPEGATGATGKSAYELAVENGFEGTLGEWLESLRGQSGGAGNSGNGIESVVKTDSDGLVDTYTITFTDGTFTTFEITNGEQCTNWLSGEGEPLSYTGNVGDFYMDTENFIIYKKVSTGWEFVTQIAQKEPDMYYYDSINAAIDAVNGGDFTTSNAQVSESEAKIAVYEKEGVPHIKLLNHPVTTSLLNITRDMVIELNGKIISCVGTDAIQVQSANVKIDGSVPGSAISVMSDKISSTVLRVVSGKCSLYGGKYEAFSYKLGTPDAPNPCMLVDDSADLYLENVDVVAMETTTGTMQGVIVKRGWRGLYF
ncbi:MAG: hypothetical protein E7354_04205 [Clostridiales bacterium]|nr:hypothetical protein [Clostridiales bacterium]